MGDISCNLDHVKPFPEGIRKWFQFFSKGGGEIWCRERWNTDSPWILQKLDTIDEEKAAQRKLKNQQNKLDAVYKMTNVELKSHLRQKGVKNIYRKNKDALVAL